MVFEGRKGFYNRISISVKMKLCRASARVRLVAGSTFFRSSIHGTGSYRTGVADPQQELDTVHGIL